MSAQTTGAEAWDDRYSSSELVWTLEPNRWVVEVLAEVEPAGRRALDLGAGEGRNSIWLAQRGWRVEAVDFSAVGLDRARQLAAAAGVGDRLVTVVDDVVDFTPAPGGFALALLCYLQLPRSERMLSVRNAARGVAPRAAPFFPAGAARERRPAAREKPRRSRRPWSRCCSSVGS